MVVLCSIDLIQRKNMQASKQAVAPLASCDVSPATPLRGGVNAGAPLAIGCALLHASVVALQLLFFIIYNFTRCSY